MPGTWTCYGAIWFRLWNSSAGNGRPPISRHCGCNGRCRPRIRIRLVPPRCTSDNPSSVWPRNSESKSRVEYYALYRFRSYGSRSRPIVIYRDQFFRYATLPHTACTFEIRALTILSLAEHKCNTRARHTLAHHGWSADTTTALCYVLPTN